MTMQETVNHPPTESAAFALPAPRDELIASLVADLAEARATSAAMAERLSWYEAAVIDAALPQSLGPRRGLQVVPDVTR